ncbi:MAG: Lrp/AsnC family transcriptional regulator [Spirochaetaceae bacterium]|nr:Lrp/AsnC family transcriptional regulator [Spirochaetaceae bacterium]
MDEILKLLEENGRISVEDLAAMTQKSEDEVRSVMKELEQSGTIIKYAAIVHPGNRSEKSVRAVIELQVTPERDRGFDAIAEKIYHFPQVKSLYLISGGYDLQVAVEGSSIEDVALLTQKFATIDGVRSTKTQFVLQIYKENDIIYVPKEKDLRQEMMA